MLLGLAAKQLGVPLSDLQVRGGVVTSKTDSSKSVTYGALLGDKPFSAPNTGRAALKPVTEYRLVGKPVKRKDTEAKVRGTHPYVHQLRLPGMLHGRIVRPKGQGPFAVADKVLSVDESSIAKIKGVKVYRKGDFIGVVAANEQDAIQAAAQLKVRWSESKTMPGSGNLWKHFREAKSAERFTRNIGSIDKGLAGAAKTEARATRSTTSRTRRSAPRAASPTSARTRSTSGARARASTAAATSCRRCSACRSRTSPSISQKARAATGRTCRTTRRWPRRSSRSFPASPCTSS